jgi:hypothetical protein
VPKEYILRRRYETMHKEEFGDFEGKLREDKFNVLKSDLLRQRNVIVSIYCG